MPSSRGLTMRRVVLATVLSLIVIATAHAGLLTSKESQVVGKDEPKNVLVIRGRVVTESKGGGTQLAHASRFSQGGPTAQRLSFHHQTSLTKMAHTGRTAPGYEVPADMFRPEQPVCPAANMMSRDGSTDSSNPPLTDVTGSFGFSGTTGKFKTFNQLHCSWLIDPAPRAVQLVASPRRTRIKLSFATGVHFAIVQNPYTDRPSGISVPPELTVYDGDTEAAAVLKRYSEADFHPKAGDWLVGAASEHPKMLVVLKTEERNSDTCVFDAKYALVPAEDVLPETSATEVPVVVPEAGATVGPEKGIGFDADA